VGQRQCSFEVVDPSWRVRDKYSLASDASMRLPLLADDSIAPKTGTFGVGAHR